MSSAYQRITDEIISRIEQGVVPWQRPWHALAPRNLVSGRAYRGVNAIVLAAQPFESGWWLTYRQAQGLGGSVKRGEHGVSVVFWQPGYERDDGRAVLRVFTVFNVEQCERIATPEIPQRSFPALERIVEGMPDPPQIEPDGILPVYRPATDTVIMPSRDAFVSREGYYSTLFHELVHSTGHERRLSRDGITKSPAFATAPYAREELIAEIGSAFLCTEGGISQPTIGDSASYLEDWLSVLHEYPAILVQSASGAQRAADYVLGRGVQGNASSSAAAPPGDVPASEPSVTAGSAVVGMRVRTSLKAGRIRRTSED